MALAALLGAPLVLYALWRLYNWYILGGARLPPVQSGWLPWVGCAMEFGREPLFFIDRTRRKVGCTLHLHLTQPLQLFAYLLPCRNCSVALKDVCRWWVTFALRNYDSAVRRKQRQRNLFLWLHDVISACTKLYIRCISHH